MARVIRASVQRDKRSIVAAAQVSRRTNFHPKCRDCRKSARKYASGPVSCPIPAQRGRGLVQKIHTLTDN
jgi:hypothetical protein